MSRAARHHARRPAAPRRRPCPASNRSSRSPTLTAKTSVRNGFLKPLFGKRRCIGIWPPSKPRRAPWWPVRAFWPLTPLPDCLARARARTAADALAVAGGARSGPSTCAASFPWLSLIPLTRPSRPEPGAKPRESCRARRRCQATSLATPSLASPSPLMVRLCVLGAVDAAPDQRHAQLLGHGPTPGSRRGVLPRSSAAASALRSCWSASIVAWMTLCGFDVPMHLVRMSWTPATSSTGRTAPPAMTPVPALAGRRSTAPAPKCPCTSCGIVPPDERDLEQVLLRLLGALADRLGHLVGLAEAGADVAALVADDDERREGEAAAALDDLGDAVDEDDAVDELADVFVIDCHQFLFRSL